MADFVVEALNQRRLVLAYQRVQAIKPGAIDFHEALMRFDANDRPVPPIWQVAATAERIGIAPELDQRVLELAAAQMRAEPDLRLAVNFSVASLCDPGFPERFTATVCGPQGVADRLIVEIVETMAIADVAAMTSVIRQIKIAGAKVALDDFGAGHTSFRNFRSLGVDMVKIDGSFVRDLARSTEDRFFVRTLAALAKNIGVEVVAEWVEDAETADMLGHWGIDYLQGFFVARPEIPAPASSVCRQPLSAS